MQQIEVPGTWDGVTTLMQFCDQAEERLALSADQQYLLRLVIEEIATNIVKYGYGEARHGVIRLACANEAGHLRISIHDHGAPFDPRDHGDPDLSGDDPALRDVGGLGLFFVRELADTLEYHHDPASGWNELVVSKGPPEPGGPA